MYMKNSIIDAFILVDIVQFMKTEKMFIIFMMRLFFSSNHQEHLQNFTKYL